MKFSELFEMPTYHNTVFPKVNQVLGVLSKRTLDADYTILDQERREDGVMTIAAINNDHSRAVIGNVIDRGDTIGLHIKCYIDFKDGLNIKPGNDQSARGILQIDYVQTNESKEENQGLAYKLYTSLINYGFSIISDNVQFIGGKAVWKKIVRQSAHQNHNVFVLQNGEYLKDETGKPVVYDGSNIPEDELWGPEGSDKHHYTLFLATMKK